MGTITNAIQQRLDFATGGAMRYFRRCVEEARYPFDWVAAHCVDDALTEEMQSALGGKGAIVKNIIDQCFPDGQIVTRAMVEKVLHEHRHLHMLGYGNLRLRSERFTTEQIKGYNAELLTPDSVSRIDTTCAWIEVNFRLGDYINHKSTSYGMKHVAEPAIGYITNGQFIVAMLLCEYRMGKPVAYNPHFNVRHDSVKRAWDASQKLRRQVLHAERTRQQYYSEVVNV